MQCSECCACLARSSPSRPERVQRVRFRGKTYFVYRPSHGAFQLLRHEKEGHEVAVTQSLRIVTPATRPFEMLQFHPYFEFHIHLTSPTCPCADWNENLPAPCRPRRGDVDSSDASAGEERAAGGPGAGGRRRRGGRNHFSFPRPSFKFPPPPLALGRSVGRSRAKFRSTNFSIPSRSIARVGRRETNSEKKEEKENEKEEV